jgi:argininosuccinate lyase
MTGEAENLIFPLRPVLFWRITQMSKKQSEPIWHGRFSQAPAQATQQFVESLSFDRRMYKHDIAGSIAHAKMLKDVGLITRAELDEIIDGLEDIAIEMDEGKFKFDPAHEDIHMAIETTLIARIGEPGKKLHTARSRNDQVALDFRLYLRDVIDLNLIPAIDALQEAFVELAKNQGHAVMPGYTHLQHAQPILAGAILLSYAEQLDRDRDRLMDCRKRMNVMPLGSAAIAGTTLPIKRNITAIELGFSEVCRNSIDGVSDRDFAAEFLFDLALTATHLSRWAEDWIMWCSSEFNFIDLDQRYCTGSSIMPQKKNPDILELIRGKTGRVYGNLINLMTILKGLPSGYNRDMQDDKLAVFEAYDVILMSLKVAAEVVSTTNLKPEVMKAQTDHGFLEATGLAEYLVKKGMPFRQAHNVVGKIVAICEKGDKKLSDLTLDELKASAEIIGEDVYQVLSAEKLVEAYQSYGSAGVKSLKEQLKYWQDAFVTRNES